ncbi:MAG: cytochrome b5 domain-containing protein [Patescibacteria group bacterium]|nr:cytochrome b5 domain-containing protein [Patescibacteria group bacterium]
MKFLYALACGAIILGAGCNSSSTTTPSGSVNQSQSVAQAGTKTYSLSDVAKHNSANDCWMAIDGKVYDVTSYIPNHPGGEQMVQGCGTDATAMFDSIKGGRGHSDYAKSLHSDYYIGDLK